MKLNKSLIINCLQKVLRIPRQTKQYNLINLILSNKLETKKRDKQKMITKHRCEKSANGFDLSCLKSGLQKYIRRGNEEMAMRCIEELDRFTEVKDEKNSGEKIRTNMLHRLQIIFLEDIGLGNINLWPLMCSWMDILFKEREKDDEKRNRSLEIQTLEMIVLNIGRSHKTRSVSFMRALCDNNFIEMKNLSPDLKAFKYIIPEEDKNEKTLLKNLDKFLKDKDWRSIVCLKKLIDMASTTPKLAPKVGPIKKIEDIMEKYMSLTESKKWFKDLKGLTERFLLYFMPLGKYLYGCCSLQSWDKEETVFLTKDGTWPQLGEFKLDDYVFDKHTKLAKNRTTEYFVKETSKVIPEVFILPQEMKRIYEIARCGQDEIELESKIELEPEIELESKIEYEFIDSESEFIDPALLNLQNETDFDFKLRIQLTTSNQKTDTYYATFNNTLYFVKGPFNTKEPIENYIKFQELKKERGIPYIEDTVLLMLYPNRWGNEDVPLGMRRSLDLTKKHPFMVNKSLFRLDQIKTKMHSSQKWEKTKVVDTDTTNHIKIDPFHLTDQQMIDYLKVIAFRLEYKLGDFADRNFMIVNNRVLSVDEEIKKGEKINLKNNLGEKKYDFIKKMFIKLRNKLDKKTNKILDKEFDEK
jgi:hypothetical protein